MSFAHWGGLGKGAGAGPCGLRGVRPPLRGEGLGELGRRLPAEAGVRGGRTMGPQACLQDHVAELVPTFGLAYVIDEIVKIFWGALPCNIWCPTP